MTTLIWLRDDLRLADHPALTAACAAAHGPVVALWIHETRRTDEEKTNGTARARSVRPPGGGTTAACNSWRHGLPTWAFHSSSPGVMPRRSCAESWTP